MSNRYERLTILFMLLNVLFAIYNGYMAYYTIKIQQQNLELISTLYNYSPVILVSVNSPLEIDYYNKVGRLKITLIVLSPHSGLVSFQCGDIKWTYNEYLDPGNSKWTKMSVLNPKNFSTSAGNFEKDLELIIDSSIYIKSEYLYTDTSYEFYAGDLNLRAIYFDVQTNATFTRDFVAAIRVSIDNRPYAMT